MPHWITEYLSNGKTESSDDQTLMIDLPENEQISMIMCEIRVTNTSTILNTRSILDAVTRFDVIADGVKTIYSLEPELASYFAFVNQNGVLPDHRFFDGGSTVTRLHLPIYFGRFWGDEEFMLDTSQYKNVQLQIPYSLNTTYESTGTFQHTITFQRPLNKMSPRGFIRSRIVKNESSPSASADTDHKLPMTYPWRYLACRVHDVDADINTNLSQVDLNIDEGRLHLLDVNADEAYYYDKLRYAHANAYVNQPVVNGQDTVHTFAEWPFPTGVVNVDTSFMHAQLDNIAGEQARITVLDAAGAQMSSDQPVAIQVKSQNPHKCLTLFDGRKTHFDPAAWTQGKITYTTGSTAPDNLITFIQEVVQQGQL